MRCESCPVAASLRCPGEGAPVLCGRPEYRETLVSHARQIAGSPAPRPPVAEYPPLLTQAGSALQAAGRFISSGLATVDRAEFDRRRSICAGCEFLDAAQDRCRKCGCALALKPWSKAEKCPEGKW